MKGLGWIYQSIGGLIPQETHSLWSGHFFPFLESYEEIQISWNLCSIGLYKQALYSLRSSLELGLLSVYWNLNDNGHKTVKKWLNAREKTPKGWDVWQKLKKHENFQYLQTKFNLKLEIVKLDQLHNYVHTKGIPYSNRMNNRPINRQTFVKKSFETWLDLYEKVIFMVLICHLVKYPIGTFKYDYFRKFGYDIPGFGGLLEKQVEDIENFIGSKLFHDISKLQETDQTTKDIIDWVLSKPDMTENEVYRQTIKLDKLYIEMSGLDNWLKNQAVLISLLTDENEIFKTKQKIARLSTWAKRKGFENPPHNRITCH